jgi:hypothetical protein
VRTAEAVRRSPKEKEREVGIEEIKVEEGGGKRESSCKYR